MKIIAIRLKNLTSIEGSLEIDFMQEPLRSAGIFAISGPTGAGKSTILDALCLALYDRAPRFAASVETVYLTDVGENLISQADVKNFLRRGMSEGYAEVDFLGVSGQRYRSRWSVRRTHSRADGSLRTQTLQVTNLDTNEEFQGSRKEILARLTEVVGLTYEQFTRTVLLAQNDFATFLKSRESAKAELLEKLTGTEVYSRISQEVFARNKAALEALNLLKSSMSFIELLPEEEFQGLLAEREQLTASRAAGIRQLAELNEHLTIVRSLKAQEEQREKKQREGASEAEKQDKLRQSLTLQTEALTRFREQCEAMQPILRKARELDVQIQTVHTGYRQAGQTLQSAQQQTAELAKKQQTGREALEASCTAMNRLLKVEDALPIALLQESPSAAPELQRMEQLLAREEQQLNLLQRANDERVVRLNAFKIHSLGEEQTLLLQQQTAVQRSRQAGEQLILLQSKQQLLSAESKTLAQQLSAKEEQVRSMHRLYENARMTMSKDVVSLRNELHEGEACPVCGSIAHPYRQEEGVADALYQSIEKEYREATDTYKQLNDKNIASLRDLRNLAEQQSVHEELLAAYPETERTPEFLTQRLTQIQNRLHQLSEKLNEYQQLYLEWQQQEEAVKKLRTYCESLRESLTRLHLQLQQMNALTEQLLMLRQAETTAQTRFNAINDELLKLQSERGALLKGKSADEAEAAVIRHEKERNTALEQARKEVDAVQERISMLQGELKQLGISIEELIAQKARMKESERLPEAIAARQEENLNTERRLSAVEALLLRQKQNCELLEVKGKELTAKQDEAERWGKLNKLIGSADGAKFKVIAQSYTLNLLLRHANRHLAYLSKRYKLQQVPDSLALQVIDCDMCDEVRTVYSLSGGESFLISLALALGLSSLSSNNLKVESLFIDEGFGSLDADSLRTAMEALEQLQMQGRKIGVISHVQEMSERISVQVRLHKSVNGKSEIVIQ